MIRNQKDLHSVFPHLRQAVCGLQPRSSGAPRWFLLGKYSPIAPLPALTHFTRGFGNARPGKRQAAWNRTRRRPLRSLPSSLASSTRMTSFRRMAGEVCRTLYTVLSRVLQASLWNTMITLVVGRGGHRLKVCSIHLWQKEQGGKKEHKDLPVLSSSPARLLRLHALPGGVFLSAATAHVCRPYHRGRTLNHLDKRARTQSSFTSAFCTQQVLECTPTCQTQHVALSQLAAAGALTHNFESLSGLTSLRFLPEISCKHTRVKKQTSVKREMCVFFRSAWG